jgi:superfamily II DNA or RNA helicase
MVLTEGFDSQPVGCIVILRPMLHKGTFIQAIGRGLRKVDPERFPGIVKTDLCGRPSVVK